MTIAPIFRGCYTLPSTQFATINPGTLSGSGSLIAIPPGGSEQPETDRAAARAAKLTSACFRRRPVNLVLPNRRGAAPDALFGVPDAGRDAWGRVDATA